MLRWVRAASLIVAAPLGAITMIWMAETQERAEGRAWRAAFTDAADAGRCEDALSYARIADLASYNWGLELVADQVAENGPCREAIQARYDWLSDSRLASDIPLAQLIRDFGMRSNIPRRERVSLAIGRHARELASLLSSGHLRFWGQVNTFHRQNCPAYVGIEMQHDPRWRMLEIGVETGAPDRQAAMDFVRGHVATCVQKIEDVSALADWNNRTEAWTACQMHMEADTILADPPPVPEQCTEFAL